MTRSCNWTGSHTLSHYYLDVNRTFTHLASHVVFQFSNIISERICFVLRKKND